jgi:hypothetical protein
VLKEEESCDALWLMNGKDGDFLVLTALTILRFNGA